MKLILFILILLVALIIHFLTTDYEFGRRNKYD